MFDIHMHIIPAVDDGARDMKMSEAMLDVAWSQGIRAIIATPHSSAYRRPEQVIEGYEALRKLVERKGGNMALALGCEVMFAGYDTKETVRRLVSGELPTLNGTRYVLTEFLPRVSVTHALDTIQQLRAADFIPVIAHAERYPKVFGDLDQAIAIHESALIQINAYSLEEESDGSIKRIARMLLDNQLVGFIGTDAHRMNHRPPNATSGIRYIRQTCDAAYARAVLWENAKRLLHLGEHLDLDVPQSIGNAL